MDTRNTWKEWGRTLAELTKARITIFVAITGAAGYILCRGAVDWGILSPMLGLFVLACGASALNQYQEREIDAKMERTRNRPIPSGKLNPQTVLQIFVVLALLGSLILLWGANFTAFALGVVALVWYNGVYLYLKKRTAFAVVPGSLLGALGPTIGWAAAGGDLLDPKILAVALFFFVWQIPHFWLLLLKYGPQYEKVGYPSLTQRLSAAQISRLIFTWTVATAVICLLIPAWGHITSRYTQIALIIACAVLVARSINVLGIMKDRPFSVQSAFRDINLYALAVTVLLAVDSLLF